MSKIKFSALVSGMSGKLNGSVFARNRSGAYVRNKTTPTNPQTIYQVEVRSRLATYSSKWRDLTQSQRNAWNSQVSEWAKTDIFGDIVNPTGKNLFTLVNMNLENAGGTPVSVPPSKVGVESPTAVTITATAGTPSLSITFGPSPVPTDLVAVVDMTAQLGAGIGYFKNQFRQIATIPTAGTSPYDALAAYTARFGALIEGKKIAVRIKFINSVTGEVSQSLVSSVIIGA